MSALRNPRFQPVKGYILIFVGCALFAVGQMIFIWPMLIPMGGFMGIVMIVGYLTSLPLGLINLLLNIPLLILGWRSMGRGFFFKTVFGALALSLLLESTGPVLQSLGLFYETQDMLLSAVAGGVVMGLGNGLVIRQEATSGGIDILGKYLAKRFDMRVGTFNLWVNVVVLGLSAIIYGDFESILYAMITIFVFNTVVNTVVYGPDVQKQATIITDKPEAVAGAIMKRLGRGVTALDGQGMYTGERRPVLLCAVRRFWAGAFKDVL